MSWLDLIVIWGGYIVSMLCVGVAIWLAYREVRTWWWP